MGWIKLFVFVKFCAVAAALYYVYQFDLNLFKAAMLMAFALMVKLEVKVK